MVDSESAREPDLAAGDFGSWVVEMHGAIRGEHGSDVPCGTCTACCTASQFVHVAPDEADALAHIPAELLFPAPRMPRGHQLLGYDERGHCPMLVDGQCSIYAHRPRTCRAYDCRVFPAAGIEVEADKVGIRAQARRWTFTYADDDGASRHAAVRAAAVFLDEHRDLLPDGAVPTNATQLAALAIEVHDLLLMQDATTAGTTVTEPDITRVRERLARDRPS